MSSGYWSVHIVWTSGLEQTFTCYSADWGSQDTALRLHYRDSTPTKVIPYTSMLFFEVGREVVEQQPMEDIPTKKTRPTTTWIGLG